LLPTYLLTYLLTPRSRVLLEKLTSSQVVKKFPAFYGIPKFITAFTRACHLFLSWEMLACSCTKYLNIIQGVSRHVDIPAGDDFLGLRDQKVHINMCPILDGYRVMGIF
jgi:hypothetical protein